MEKSDKISKWIAGTGSVDADLYRAKADFIEFMLGLVLDTDSSYIRAINEKMKFEESVVNFDSKDSNLGAYLKKRFPDDILLKYLDKFTQIGFSPFECEEYKYNEWLVFSLMLFQFYNKVLPGRNFQNLDIGKISKIDFTLSKIALLVGGRYAVTIDSAHYSHDKKIDLTNLRSLGKAAKKEKRKQQAIEIYYTIDPKKRKIGKYPLADAIITRWVPANQAPSRDTIIRYLIEEKLIE